jgi:hypothetical protein
MINLSYNSLCPFCSEKLRNAMYFGTTIHYVCVNCASKNTDYKLHSLVFVYTDNVLITLKINTNSLRDFRISFADRIIKSLKFINDTNHKILSRHILEFNSLEDLLSLLLTLELYS